MKTAGVIGPVAIAAHHLAGGVRGKLGRLHPASCVRSSINSILPTSMVHRRVHGRFCVFVDECHRSQGGT